MAGNLRFLLVFVYFSDPCILRYTLFLPLPIEPTVLLYRQSVSVFLEGNYTVVSFLCKATGNPRPLIGWLKDNSTKANGTVIQTGSISMLIVVLVGKDNKRGKVSCVAKNLIGEAYSKEAKLEFLTQGKHKMGMWVYCYMDWLDSNPRHVFESISMTDNVWESYDCNPS